jgi:hypothetical protein
MRSLSTPWYAENVPGGFVVRDADRKPVAYVYGHERPWQSQGAPRPLTIDEAREMALAIAKLAEVLMREDPQDTDQHPPPSAGEVAKCSRSDATSPPHTKSPHPPIPVLNGRPKARLSTPRFLAEKHQNGREGGEGQRAAQ